MDKNLHMWFCPDINLFFRECPGSQVTASRSRGMMPGGTARSQPDHQATRTGTGTGTARPASKVVPYAYGGPGHEAAPIDRRGRDGNAKNIVLCHGGGYQRASHSRVRAGRRPESG